MLLFDLVINLCAEIPKTFEGGKIEGTLRSLTRSNSLKMNENASIFKTLFSNEKLRFLNF